MIEEWQYGTPMDESAFGTVEYIGLFDHDYEQHLLVQEWDFFADNPCWIYALWFHGVHGLELVHRWDSPEDVTRWDEGRIPWVEAAGLVVSWSKGRRG